MYGKVPIHGFLICLVFRTAIEEELEVLYEAYYEDLEHYANLQQQHVTSGGPPPPGPGPFPGSVALDQNGAVIGVQHPSTKHPPGRGKAIAPPPVTNGRKPVQQPQRNANPQEEEEYDDEEGDEYDDEEYDDEEEEDEGEDDEEGEDEEDTSKSLYLGYSPNILLSTDESSYPN